MKKRIILMALLSFSGLLLADTVRAESETAADLKLFESVYSEGKSKGILTDSNSSKKEFVKYCYSDAFPRYLEYLKLDSTTSFEQYVSDENYFVSYRNKDDHPDTISASDHQSNRSSLFTSFIAARSGYKMKGGDILVCHGKSGTAYFVGHAAIATSANYILEMPGPGRTVAHPSKESFFKAHTKNGDYVDVYRIKKHPHYADAASTYAYRHLYVNPKDRPKYGFAYGLYNMTESYCSKYVYYAYYKVLPAGAIQTYKGPHIVHPYTFVGNFKGSYVASNIHKINKW